MNDTTAVYQTADRLLTEYGEPGTHEALRTMLALAALTGFGDGMNAVVALMDEGREERVELDGLDRDDEDDRRQFDEEHAYWTTDRPVEGGSE